MSAFMRVYSSGMYTMQVSRMPRSSFAFTARFKMIALVYDTFCETYRRKAASVVRIPAAEMEQH